VSVESVEEVPPPKYETPPQKTDVPVKSQKVPQQKVDAKPESEKKSEKKTIAAVVKAAEAAVVSKPKPQTQKSPVAEKVQPPPQATTQIKKPSVTVQSLQNVQKQSQKQSQKQKQSQS